MSDARRAARGAVVINLPGVIGFKLRPSAPPRAQHRSRWRHYEAHQQRKLAELLRRLIVPGTVHWTAIENKPRTAISGMYQKLAGVRSGFPDMLFLRKDKPAILIEMKSPAGTLSKAQREIRSELLAQGCRWFLCRSALGALAALHRAGVEFRSVGGRPWQPPRPLRPWEEPVENPSKPHPRHPSVTAQHREAKRRQRQARRERAARQTPQVESEITVWAVSPR
jgi:VRR-NUC domain